MKLSVLAVSTLAAVALNSPAFADLKCGDGRRSAPFEFSPGELVTTWAGPIPQKSKVTVANSTVFDAASRDLGSDIPAGFPDKYTRDLKKVEIFNLSIAWNVEQLIDAEKHYGFIIDKGDSALPIFEKYAKTHHDFITAVVQHPSVSGSARSFSSCSVVLQRGIIEHVDGKETLFLRSYFHSSNGAGEFVNFVPEGGLRITFQSPEIWFPLSLTKVIPEPTSYVVLDILTSKPLDQARLGSRFRAEAGKQVNFNGKNLNAVRITGSFQSGKDLEDLRLRP